MNDRSKSDPSKRSTAASLPASACERPALGFALFDADLRLLRRNARFGTLRAYPRKLLKAGTPLEAIVRFDAERGEYGAGAVDALVRRELAAVNRRRRTEREQTHSDGPSLRIACERLPEGGLLLTCEDLSSTSGTPQRLRESEDRAAIAVENVRLSQENVRLFNETREALAQQTATAEILRAISASPTSTDPVFDVILQNGTKLCDADLGLLFRHEAGAFQGVATRGANPEFDAYLRQPIHASPQTGLGRVAASKAPVHIPDLVNEAAYRAGDPLRLRSVELGGVRTWLGVPMLREGHLIGAIAIYRKEVRPFDDRQVALLRTFADQAVIAVENVRLFNETKEALDYQKASAEVLQVISSSVADTQPVFEKILESLVRLFEGRDVEICLVGDDGAIYQSAYRGPNREELMRLFPLPLSEASGSGSAILQRRVIQYPDTDAADVPEYVRRGARIRGNRSVLYAPMLWEGRGIGSMLVGRAAAGEFSEKEIALAKTFADQAVIAIQNARLFNETKEALDQLKASAEVLQVISSSVAETTPVFEKIVESCGRLFEGRNVGICLVGEDGAVHLAAYQGPNREALERHFPVPLSEESGAGTAILRRRVIHYADVEGRAAVPDYVRRGARIAGYKSVMLAPMLWEGRGIGAILVGRATVGEFSEKELGLLKTFADQAVIAIQNAKLFHEIQDKSHQLEIANQHKSAFLANMSHELRTPLNAVIGFSEMLAARYFGDLTDKQAEYVGDIHASGKHLLSLINDILDLSKIEAGRTELEVGEFDLRAALDNALTLVRERAQRSGVTLRLEADPGVGAFRGDERKVKQVVLNLLSNAVKFTPRGGAVGVSAKQANGSAEIAVSDTGVGIALADQEAIFEAFRQVGTDVTRKREGTGLGLALTRRFVELHGGTISVESQPGNGSTFTVRLPVRHGE